MRALAQEPTASRQLEIARPERPGREHPVRDGTVKSILRLQHTVGNRVVQGVLHAPAAGVAHSPAVTTTRRVNTLLRVPQPTLGAARLSRDAHTPIAPPGPGVAPGLATAGARPVDPPEVMDRLKAEAKADALRIKQLLYSSIQGAP